MDVQILQKFVSGYSEKQNFRPNDPSTGWDGKVKGVPATSGVFVYIAEVICENDIRYVYKGNVTLIN
jgi:hypothetical protein